MSRYIVGLLDDIFEGEACEAAITWARSLRPETTAREAPEHWQAEIALQIGVRGPRTWNAVQARLEGLGIWTKTTPLLEAGSFVAQLRGDRPRVPPHSADAWTLAFCQAIERHYPSALQVRP